MYCIYLLDLLAGKCMLDRFHRKDVLDLQWSSDGAFLISGSVDNSCIIWDMNKGMHSCSMCGAL